MATYFETGSKGMLSRYTSGMREVKRAYKKQYGMEKNTLYLFFMDFPGIDKNGYMPLTGHYGFIFNFDLNQIHTIPHELGHGAFNLRHTFSEEATHLIEEGRSDNLMDYGRPPGTKLWKYQWDLIHDPENVLFAWTEEEEEGESQLWSDAVCTQKF
ncbi:MAG: hypothetical protein ACQETL_20000, partial [Bacteroidota bacterium]